MPLPINHSGNLRKQFLKRQLSTTSAGNNSYLTERQKENVKKHITRYRRNWDIFVEEVFQIKLYPIQNLCLALNNMCNHNHNYNAHIHYAIF